MKAINHWLLQTYGLTFKFDEKPFLAKDLIISLFDTVPLSEIQEWTDMTDKNEEYRQKLMNYVSWKELEDLITTIQTLLSMCNDTSMTSTHTLDEEQTKVIDGLKTSFQVEHLRKLYDSAFVSEQVVDGTSSSTTKKRKREKSTSTSLTVVRSGKATVTAQCSDKEESEAELNQEPEDEFFTYVASKKPVWQLKSSITRKIKEGSCTLETMKKIGGTMCVQLKTFENMQEVEKSTNANLWKSVTNSYLMVVDQALAMKVKELEKELFQHFKKFPGIVKKDLRSTTQDEGSSPSSSFKKWY